MNLLMVGTGYVGLVTAALFSEMGHTVICLDIDEKKIGSLRQGILPFFEPGLKEIVLRNMSAGRLSFTCDYSKAVRASSVCFIAVPTPPQENGACDLSHVLSAAGQIAQEMHQYCLIVTKSTVPVGSADQVKQTIAEVLQERGVQVEFDVVSNPEFLKEGSAVQDCLKPDRIIIGADNPRAADLMRKIYSAFTWNHDRILLMDIRSAEMTKYAANAMLATRISFMNELALLCEKTGANINHVRLGIGSDQRIGYQFLYAGIGYGGSCFPKDIKALQMSAREEGVPMSILEAVEKVNARQRELFIDKIIAYFSCRGRISGKTLALWGLAFKPDTDDIREAPSLTLIEKLQGAGFRLKLYDPVASSNVQKIYPDLTYTSDEYEAARDADGIVLITEWKQFRFVNFDKLKSTLKGFAFFDGRNQYQPDEMHARGFDYMCIGMGTAREQHECISSRS